VFTSERDLFTTAGFGRMFEEGWLANRGHDTAASSPRPQEQPARGTLYSAVADAVRALAEVCNDKYS
jgi:hypothetical protein